MALWLAEIFEDALNGAHLGDEGDDPHRLATAGAEEREDLHPRRARRPVPGAGFHSSVRAAWPRETQHGDVVGRRAHLALR